MRRAASTEGRMEEERAWRRDNTGQDGRDAAVYHLRAEGDLGRLSETLHSRQIHEEYRSSFKGAMRETNVSV